MSKEYISDKVFAEFGGDPRVVATLSLEELSAVQHSVAGSVFQKDVVRTPSKRGVLPKYEGLGPTTDAQYNE